MAKSARLQRFLEMRKENVENRPQLGGQLDAMVRDIAKDVRQTVMEVYTGKGEHAAEIGTPQNPTQAMQGAALNPELYGRSKAATKTKDGPDLDM